MAIHYLTVDELAEQYLDHEEQRFGPTYKQTYAAKYAMLALTEQHAGLRADQFRPKALQRIQRRLIEQNYARREVNERINRIRRAFQWAASEELVDESVWASLKTLKNVRAGEACDNPPRQPDPSTMFRWCQSEQLPSVRVAGHIYVQAADLNSFLEAQPVSRSGRDAEHRRRDDVAAGRFQRPGAPTLKKLRK